MLELIPKNQIESIRTEFMRLNNRSENMISLLPSNILKDVYSPLIWDLPHKKQFADEIYLGTLIESERDFITSFSKLFKRSMSVDGSSGSGKSTFVVRLIVEILQYEYVILDGRQMNIRLVIIDPDRDVYQVFSNDPRVEYIDISDCDEVEAWAYCIDVFERSLNRPLIKDADNFEIIIIEEAEDIAPEKGDSLGDLDKSEIKVLNKCVRRYRQHARKCRKRGSISISVIQNPFNFRKSVLRQIKTHFLFQLEDKRQVDAFSKPWLDARYRDIIESETGVCHAYGEGIQGRTKLFYAAQVDELKTSDV